MLENSPKDSQTGAFSLESKLRLGLFVLDPMKKHESHELELELIMVKLLDLVTFTDPSDFS
jgi:hypothetical protein